MNEVQKLTLRLTCIFYLFSVGGIAVIAVKGEWQAIGAVIPFTAWSFAGYVFLWREYQRIKARRQRRT